MEGFTQDVVAYMKAHPEHVAVALLGAYSLCQKDVTVFLADDGYDRAHAHVFKDSGCSLCQKLFLATLRQQEE
jgi:hypothetical protein